MSKLDELSRLQLRVQLMSLTINAPFSTFAKNSDPPGGAVTYDVYCTVCMGKKSVEKASEITYQSNLYDFPHKDDCAYSNLVRDMMLAISDDSPIEP